MEKFIIGIMIALNLVIPQEREIKPINIKKLPEINFMEEINESVKNKIYAEIIVEEKDLEYQTNYIEDSELPKGYIQIIQEGRTGREEVVVKKMYENEILKNEEVISNKVIKSQIDKIALIGSGNKSIKKYMLNVGDNVYVSSITLSVRNSPNMNANKRMTLNKEDMVRIISIQENWYEVEKDGISGWVLQEYLTKIDPKQNEENENIFEYTKAELLAKLDFNVDLTEPSGLSIEQFRKILLDENDSENIFSANADIFYYIEKQYNINGVFIAALGIHESAWGTSHIANDKNNLFGYGANDEDPYQNAYDFSGYKEGIDLVSRMLVKHYLHEDGEEVYEGEIASGSFYHGKTLTAINVCYATDKHWAVAVYNWMEYLYNKI